MTTTKKTIVTDTVSITFSTDETVKNKIVQYAQALNMTRKVNGQNSKTGDVSKGVNILLEFALANIEQVEQYRANKVAEMLKRSPI